MKPEPHDAVNQGMIIVAFVPNERFVTGARCPNCLRPFKAFDTVFESVDQTVAIHVHCVVALALVAAAQPPKQPTAEHVEAVYRRTRQELLGELVPDGQA